MAHSNNLTQAQMQHLYAKAPKENKTPKNYRTDMGKVTARRSIEDKLEQKRMNEMDLEHLDYE